DLMNERMLIADLQARNPPLVHIGMIATVVRDMNALPSSQGAFIRIIKDFEAMQIVKIPPQRHFLSVDLERVECLMSARITGGFKQSQRAVGEVAQKSTGVVDGDLLLLSGCSVDPFLDERF